MMDGLLASEGSLLIISVLSEGADWSILINVICDSIHVFIVYPASEAANLTGRKNPHMVSKNLSVYI